MKKTIHELEYEIRLEIDSNKDPSCASAMLAFYLRAGSNLNLMQKMYEALCRRDSFFNERWCENFLGESLGDLDLKFCVADWKRTQKSKHHEIPLRYRLHDIAELKSQDILRAQANELMQEQASLQDSFCKAILERRSAEAIAEIKADSESRKGYLREVFRIYPR